MKLTKMTREEFDIWAPRSKASYAADKISANNLTQSEANEIAEKDFGRLLPQGMQTADTLLFAMKDHYSEILGFLWIMARGPADNRKAFICDIIVEEKFRGKGYGRQAMRLAEDEAKKLGLGEIGLHVFGFNAPAIALYKSLGYEITDLVMAKTLP